MFSRRRGSEGRLVPGKRHGKTVGPAGSRAEGGVVTGTADSPVREVVRRPSHAVITVAGELDLGGREHLRDSLEELLTGGCCRIVVDLRDLTFCDSTGLGILVGARKRANALGGWLRLTIPGTLHVRKVFAVTGLTRLFLFFPDPQAAAADLSFTLTE
jgi:anti-sigma B factor antagonist